MKLVRPAVPYVPSYKSALERGWSPDNVRPDATRREQLARIETDAKGFVAGLEDLEAKGGTVTLPDGSQVPRLPWFARWMWTDEFCGSISFRWQRGTTQLPAHVLGHIGYSVVPWMRGRGYAKQALALMLGEVKRIDELTFVELTTDPGNVASQKVIEACGGVLVERFNKGPSYANAEGLRYRIELAER